MRVVKRARSGNGSVGVWRRSQAGYLLADWGSARGRLSSQGISGRPRLLPPRSPRQSGQNGRHADPGRPRIVGGGPETGCFHLTWDQLKNLAPRSVSIRRRSALWARERETGDGHHGSPVTPASPNVAHAHSDDGTKGGSTATTWGSWLARMTRMLRREG